MTIPRIILAILLLCVPARADDPRLPALPPGHSWNWSRVRFRHRSEQRRGNVVPQSNCPLAANKTGTTVRAKAVGVLAHGPDHTTLSVGGAVWRGMQEP